MDLQYTELQPTKEEFLNAVNGSFVADEKKQFLIAQIGQEGVTDDLLTLFSNNLVEIINHQGDEFSATLKDFEQLSRELGNHFEEEKRKAEEQLNKELADPSLSFERRQSLWNTYYSLIKNLNSEYEEKLKAAVSNGMISAMRQ